MAVPWVIALTHTGAAPLKGKKLSQAIPPARGVASVSASSSVLASCRR